MKFCSKLAQVMSSTPCPSCWPVCCLQLLLENFSHIWLMDLFIYSRSEYMACLALCKQFYHPRWLARSCWSRDASDLWGWKTGSLQEDFIFNVNFLTAFLIWLYLNLQSNLCNVFEQTQVIIMCSGFAEMMDPACSCLKPTGYLMQLHYWELDLLIWPTQMVHSLWWDYTSCNQALPIWDSNSLGIWHT